MTKRTKPYRFATATERQQIFQVGNLVPAYGGTTDTVVQYHANTDGTWFVSVKGTDGRIRHHSTEPQIVVSNRLVNNPRVAMKVNDIPVRK